MNAQRHPPRPQIGLLSSSGSLREGGWPVYAGDAVAANAIALAGGYPVIIPTMALAQGYDPFNILADDDAFEDVFAVVWQTISRLDGLLLTGGGDVYACLYRQVMHPQTGTPEGWRDIWERYFTLVAWHLAFPTLGICRGLQVMNVVLGGSLIQDVEGRWPRSRHQLLTHRAPGRIRAGKWARHPVILNPTSQLAAILRGWNEPVPSCQCLEGVLSMHHQIIGYVTSEATLVGDLAPGLSVSATAPDGVIEGIEAINLRRFWLGVQFHPEWQAVDWAHRLFQSLIAAARPFHLTTEQVSELRTRVRLADRPFQPGRAMPGAPMRVQPAPFHQEVVDEVALP